MTFQIDEKTMMITGYKGDTASFTFQFDRDLSNATVSFFVKKNVGDSEDKAVLKKEFVNPSSTAVLLQLSEEDTQKLGTPSATYRDYYWCLKIKIADDFVQTLVPNNFGVNPIFRVYP